jgi:hypothetical protein
MDSMRSCVCVIGFAAVQRWLLIVAAGVMAAAEPPPPFLGRPLAAVPANIAPGAPLPVVREGELYRCTVTVRNRYDRAVKLTGIDSSCPCNDIQLQTRFLLPGEAMVVTVSATTAGRSGDINHRVWLFPSDSELEPLEFHLRYHIRERVAVDLLGPNDQPGARPADLPRRDIGRLVVTLRPDEPQRLQRNLLVSCPAEERPPGGLRISGVEYAGRLWRFEVRQVDDRHLLVLARGIDGAVLTSGEYEERFVIRSNHPDRPALPMEILTVIDPKAGQQQNPFE